MSFAALGGDAIVGEFLVRLAADRTALAGILARAAPETGRFDNGDLARIETLAHRLAGAAGLFGYPEIGMAAAELEEAAIRSLAGKAAGAPLAPMLAAFLAKVDAVLRRS